MSTNPDLRHQLLTHIDKLSDRSTFPTSSAFLSHLATTLPISHLPTFLSSILSLDSATKSPARVHCISLLSLLSVTHPPPSLSTHLPKILAFLLRRLRDTDSSSAVRAAVASAVAAVASHHPVLVIDTLSNSVFTEQHGGAQLGCCVCLKAAVESVGVSGLTDGGKLIARVVKLLKGDAYKAKAGLIGVMESVVGCNGGIVINGKNGGSLVVESVVGCAVEMLSCEDWAARKGAAMVLQVVADVVDVGVVIKVKGFVVSSLESRRFDKVKVARETMNRAWEAWKAIPGGPDEVMPLSRSSSSFSKDYGSSGGGSPPLPRRSSFTTSEASKIKKTMTKSTSLSMSSSTRDNIVPELPKGKHTLSKSRSSLSDDSTITDSSSISKSSHDFGFETPQSKKHMLKSRLSLPEDFSESKQTQTKTRNKKLGPYQNDDSRKSLDWKIEIAVPSAPSTKCESEDEIGLQDRNMEVTTSSSETSNFYRSSEERIKKTGFRNRAQVNPVVEVGEVDSLDVQGGPYEQVGESTAESEELSLIRNQLSQIERQQSDLLDLVQRFMGKSQNGIESLETRVSGLERALDVISHDLAIQTGRIPNNGSAGSTCCPSTEFLSPKFWRRAEGRSSNSKPSYPGNLPNRDTNPETLLMDGYRVSEQNEIKSRDLWGNQHQTSQRGRTCSPRSFDSASTTAFITPVVKGA
ncbi:TORTIFOLIA1-like protein 4 [Silene latifolia]|uniref:TORTIFOLIA1-like protein 4 n=1 Tax=Silene latifolia TaxID=37657 RepID=UPI003D787174